jgi:hypothetical protein
MKEFYGYKFSWGWSAFSAKVITHDQGHLCDRTLFW